MGLPKVTGTNRQGREIRRPGKYCTTDTTDEDRKRKKAVQNRDKIQLKRRAIQMVESVARQTSSTARSSSIHRSVSSQKMISVRSDRNGQKYSQASSNLMRSTSVPLTRNASQPLEFEEHSERPVSEKPKAGTTYETHISYASNNTGNVSNVSEDLLFSSHGNPLPSTSQNVRINSKSNRSSLVTFSSLHQNNLPGTEENEAHNVSIDENTRASNHSYLDLPDLHTDFNTHPVVVIHQDATRNFSSKLNSQSTAVIDKTRALSSERAPGDAQFPLQDLTTQMNQRDNLQNPNLTIASHGNFNGEENLLPNRVSRIPPVKDQITMTEFNQFKNELRRELEAQNQALLKKIEELDRNVRRSIANNENHEDRYNVPIGIPFRTLNDFVNFENGEGLAKQELKSYLRFVGGVSHKEAVNQFLKETVSDTLVSEFTWIGGLGKQKLKGTTFAKTLHGALSCCHNLRKLSAAEFDQAMQHGLHVAKQRARDRNRVRHRNDEASNEEEYSEDDSYSHDSRGDSVADDVEDSDH